MKSLESYIIAGLIIAIVVLSGMYFYTKHQLNKYIQKVEEAELVIAVLSEREIYMLYKLDSLSKEEGSGIDSIIYKTTLIEKKLKENEEIYKNIRPNDDVLKNINIFESSVIRYLKADSL